MIDGGGSESFRGGGSANGCPKVGKPHRVIAVIG